MSIKDLVHFALVVVFAIASGIAIATLISVFNSHIHRHQRHARGLPSQRRARLPLTMSSEGQDSESFYRTIIDNNLFRPLGWTPPRPIEPYRLIGTILFTDGHTVPQAIIQTTATNITHIVTIGDKLNAATKIVDIQSKRVTLSTNGAHRTLYLPISF